MVVDWDGFRLTGGGGARILFGNLLELDGVECMDFIDGVVLMSGGVW